MINLQQYLEQLQALNQQKQQEQQPIQEKAPDSDPKGLSQQKQISPSSTPLDNRVANQALAPQQQQYTLTPRVQNLMADAESRQNVLNSPSDF